MMGSIWYNIHVEKDIFTIKENSLSYGRGYVYSLQYHLVWCTKYRKKVLANDVECRTISTCYWIVNRSSLFRI